MPGCVALAVALVSGWVYLAMGSDHTRKETEVFNDSPRTGVFAKVDSVSGVV